MPTQVTDPNLLQQLGGAPAAPAASGPTQVTDPDLLGQLNTEPGPPPEKPPTPAEAPDVEVGGGAFTAAAHAAQPFVDTAAGTVQYGAQVLHSLGLPVDQNAAARLADDIRTGYARFKERSQEHYGTSDVKRPNTSTAGDVAGQLLLYGVTGPEFAVSGVAKVLPAAGRTIGKLLIRSVQGGTLGALQSQPGEDVGTNAFTSAVGAAFGEAGGMALGKASARIANSVAIRRTVKLAQKAAQSWVGDSMRLATGFKNVLNHVAATTNSLERQVARFKMADTVANGGAKPAAWSARTQKAMDNLTKYQDKTDFLNNKAFNKIRRAGDATAGAGATHPLESNDELLKYVMGNDSVASKVVSKGMTTQMRDVLRAGVVSKAIEKATNTDNGAIDPVKLKAILTTKGVQQFFQMSPKYSGVVDGLVNIVTEGRTIAEKHPWILAHGVSRVVGRVAGEAGLAGAGAGYEYQRKGSITGSLAEFVLFFGVLHGASRMLKSQAGINLLSAAAKSKPGTPMTGRAFAKFFEMIGAPAGAAIRQQLTSSSPQGGDSDQTPSPDLVPPTSLPSSSGG